MSCVIYPLSERADRKEHLWVPVFWSRASNFELFFLLNKCCYVISLTVRGLILRVGFTPTRRSSSSCLSRGVTELQLMVQ